MFCPSCGMRQPMEHRYCVSCGTKLPREMLRAAGPKVSRWFLTIPVAPDDPPSAALRASRYLEEIEITTAEGSVRVPSHHVRFSIWVDDHAVAAVSISDDEADRLAQFLSAWIPEDPPAEGPKGRELSQQ